MRAVLALIREQHQINRPDGSEIALAKPLFADQAAQHVAELLHFRERFAGLAVPSVAEDVEWTGAVFDPVRPKAGRGEQDGGEDPAQHLPLS